MRLLDLFCGAGGAAMGYHRAGFNDIMGVDIVPQKNYPFEFVQDDALSSSILPGEFDLIHASPPCQAYSTVTPNNRDHPDLYAATRRLLQESGTPWVIENVIGAPYDSGIILCGSMFDLTEGTEWIRRHRNFETSWMMFQPEHHHLPEAPIQVTGNAFITAPKTYQRGKGRYGRQGPFDLASRLMGIEWMTKQELTQAIPPAYTEYLGTQFLDQLARQG